MNPRTPFRVVRKAGRLAAAGTLEAVVRIAARTSGISARDRPSSDPQSIFVLRNNDVGDLLIVTPLFEALRRRFPSAHIAAGVGSWNLDVLRRNPHLSEVLPLGAPWFNKYQASTGALGRLRYLLRSPEVRALAKREFELGIDVLGSAWGALLFLRAGIRQRIGVRGYAGGESGFQRSIPYDPHLQVGTASLRFASLLGASILPPSRPQVFLDREERALGEVAWAEHEPEGIRSRRVIVGPGGGLETKRWPAERFAELTRRLADSPQAKSLSLLVLGGPGEEDLVSRVAAASPRQAWAPPSTPSLRSVFALVQACDLVVCNSSMLLHAAAAFSKPSLTLLGPSFSSASQHQVQWGYPGLSRSLGREAAAGDRIASAEEAFDAVRAELERLEPRRAQA